MPSPPPARVAVAVLDATLRERVHRLAAVAGVEALAATVIESSWRSADSVVLDAAAARAALATPAGRRHRLVVVTDAEPAVDVWQAAVRLGAEAVATLPRDERVLTTWLAGTAQPAARGRLIACLGIRGGAGTSTLAAALALAAARAGPALAVDLDPAAGGLDLLLGLENEAGARWDGFADAAGVMSADDLAAALPATGPLRVLSCSPHGSAPVPTAVETVLEAGLAGHGLVVADLPPYPTGSAEYAMSAADTVVLVVPAEVRSVTVAAATVSALAERCRDLRLVVRHPGPGDLRAHDVSAAVGRDVAEVWPWDRRLGRIVDAGAFARSWRRTSVAHPARRLAALLAATSP